MYMYMYIYYYYYSDICLIKVQLLNFVIIS